MPDNKILVSRPYYQGLGLGLETWWPRSWSWSRAFFKGLDIKSGYLFVTMTSVIGDIIVVN